MKNTVFLLFIAITLVSCSKPLAYKYQDLEQIINCPGLDSRLMHEAYYSFRNDIAEYAMKNNIEVEYLNYYYSLALYIFKGAEGTADYEEIASPHTKNILENLKKEYQLWDKQPNKSNLNYNSDFMNCLIENIQNENIKQAILSSRDTNTQNPKSLADLYRINIKDTKKDNYFSMFLAFETYYQYLYDLDF